MILQDYNTIEEALAEAKHWTENIIAHYRRMGRSLKADGMQEGMDVLKQFLERVKTPKLATEEKCK